MGNMYYFTADEVRSDYPGELHACPFEALMYAPGPMLHKVGSRVESLDARELLREFAKWCALQVITKWSTPDVVFKYLETGDESLRAKIETAEIGVRMAVEAARKSDVVWAARAGAEAAIWALMRWGLTTRTAIAKQREKFKQLVDEAFGD